MSFWFGIKDSWTATDSIQTVVLTLWKPLVKSLKRSPASLPVDSIFLGIAAGISFVMLHTQLLSVRKQAMIWKSGYEQLARIAGIALVMHILLSALELATLAWSGSFESRELLHLLFGEYGALYAAEWLLFLAAMAGYLFGRSRSGVLPLLNTAVLMGLFIHRVMMTLPAFNMVPLTISVGSTEPLYWAYPVASGIYQEGQDIFLTGWQYAPTLIEWGVTALPLGVLILLCTAALPFCRNALSDRTE